MNHDIEILKIREQELWKKVEETRMIASDSAALWQLAKNELLRAIAKLENEAKQNENNQPAA